MISARGERIAFLREATVRDRHGEPQSGWAVFGHAEWAQVFWGSGAERREAAQQVARQSATFSVLRNKQSKTITRADRVQAAGRLWDITNIAPSARDPARIEFTTIETGHLGAPAALPDAGMALDFSDPANSGLLVLCGFTGLAEGPPPGPGLSMNLDFSAPANSGLLAVI